MAASLSDLEANAAKYRGKIVKVKGEVDRVLGPRLFTIDEKMWVDFDGETIVLAPAPLAALVREDAAITVTGTVRPLTLAEVRNEWGVFDAGSEIEIALASGPAPSLAA
jgi:hypothetical protein